jgi:hypothetical protein
MDIFSVTAPLTIRLSNGEKHIIAEKYLHKDGFLYFEPYWHERPIEDAVHFIEGELNGDGPWKVDNAVISVVGCQGTDPQLAAELASWQTYLQTQADQYPSRSSIDSIAKQLGAIILS